MNIRKSTTVSKGYRLKPETHKLIKKIQKELDGTQEEVISNAIKTFCVTLKNGNDKKLNNFQEETSKCSTK